MFINKNFPIGLNITDESIKLIQLTKKKGKPRVLAIAKINLPPAAVVDGEIKQKEILAKALKKAWESSEFGKFTTDEVAVSLPEQKTFIKLIEIEKNPNDIANIIEAEIEKHIPFQIKDIYYDWQIVKKLPDKELILIGAAPKKLVDDYADAIEEAGLSVAAMEIESVSVCRSFFPEKNDKIINNYALLNIGPTKTSLIIYAQGIIIFTMNMPISGKEITEKISSYLQLNDQLSEKAKSICGLTANKAQGIIKNILIDSIDSLTNKINEAIEFYQNHFPFFGAINKIILCGSEACLKDLDKIIALNTKIPAETGDITANLSSCQDKLFIMFKEKQCQNINLIKNNKTANGDKDASAENTITYATAIGLALREIFRSDYL
jgi:type IV pilus assembly protein PilM